MSKEPLDIFLESMENDESVISERSKSVYEQMADAYVSTSGGTAAVQQVKKSNPEMDEDLLMHMWQTLDALVDLYEIELED